MILLMLIYSLLSNQPKLLMSLDWINKYSTSNSPIIVNCSKGFDYKSKMTFYQLVSKKFRDLKILIVSYLDLAMQKR